ncbi:MAG: MerR family transcriptional regulator [Hydrogenophaga sp.]|uniref:MerR family transcriptional regulator n=1 Tax=Hydrogenophaga sp. TaxID=1904254 RepID=UPI003D9BD502
MTEAAHTIADVERDTGLSKDTLRVWERRYGFPLPLRDAQGERRYDGDQLLRLRHIRRLLDAGHRPGRVVPLPLAQLLALDTPARPQRMQGAAKKSAEAPVPASAAGPDLSHWMDLLRTQRSQPLHQALQQWLLVHGLASLVRDVVAPLNRRVGQAWLDGELAVFEEHLYTELVQRLLRTGLSQVAAASALRPPRVLLTTVPGEVHTLGLLMAECMLVLEGCETTSLGAQTPLRDIAEAARAGGADVVALGFSALLKPRDARHALEQLLPQLPPAVQLWTGGQCPALQTGPRGAVPLPGHTHMAELDQIAPAVARWRTEHTTGVAA